MNIMKSKIIKNKLLLPVSLILITILLTVLVLFESIYPIWAPFFICYAIILIIIPVYLKSFTFGSFKKVIKEYYISIILILFIAIVTDIGIFNFFYKYLLVLSGLSNDPNWSSELVMKNIFLLANYKTGLSINILMGIYAIFYLLWAPVGEELFYRGYFFKSLQNKIPYWLIIIISSAFFGIRHATHFLFLYPDYPYGLALNWVLNSFIFGLLAGYLYKKTNSLYAVMIIHFIINLIDVLIS